MKQIPEVGDHVSLKTFSFTNKSGGTGMSNWKFDEKFEGPAVVVVTKAWHDYECGGRYIGKPHDTSALLREYLSRNARRGSPVYFSEFEIKGVTMYSDLYREDATQDEQVECYQALINNGQAWRLEGHVGRTAMGLIEAGQCILGHDGHRDYWGNYVPNRFEVMPGSKGSYQYVVEHAGKEHADKMAKLGAS